MSNHKTSCPNDSTHPTQYIKKYDAYYCFLCEEWAEDVCSDEECEFCSDRPDKLPLYVWNDANHD